MSDALSMPVLKGGNAISQIDGRLAWELAAEIAPVEEILQRYGLSAPEFRQKLKDSIFRQAVREAKILWKSDLNIEQRIKLKARLLVEDSLLDIFAVIKNENISASPKLEAFEKLMRAADVVPRVGKQDAQPGAGFRININLGSTDKSVVIDAHAIPENLPIPA